MKRLLFSITCILTVWQAQANIIQVVGTTISNNVSMGLSIAKTLTSGSFKNLVALAPSRPCGLLGLETLMQCGIQTINAQEPATIAGIKTGEWLEYISLYSLGLASAGQDSLSLPAKISVAAPRIIFRWITNRLITQLAPIIQEKIGWKYQIEDYPLVKMLLETGAISVAKIMSDGASASFLKEYLIPAIKSRSIKTA